MKHDPAHASAGWPPATTVGPPVSHGTQWFGVISDYWRSFKERWPVALLITVVTVAVVSAMVAWWHKSGPYHFLVVTPGRLYRSGTLDPADLEEVIRDHHIRTVVNLRTEGENCEGNWHAREAEVCARNGTELVELPVDEPPSLDQVHRWFRILEEPSSGPVLVHCKHGGIRTGVMVALYQMEYLGKPPLATVGEMPLFGHPFDDPRRSDLLRFLLDYKPRGGAKADAAR